MVGRFQGATVRFSELAGNRQAKAAAAFAAAAGAVGAVEALKDTLQSLFGNAWAAVTQNLRLPDDGGWHAEQL
jgi:hypothetical protein